MISACGLAHDSVMYPHWPGSNPLPSGPPGCADGLKYMMLVRVLSGGGASDTRAIASVSPPRQTICVGLQVACRSRRAGGAAGER